MTTIGWDSAETASYYEAFCRRHSRYDEANRALVAQASLRATDRILDYAAGTGRTAEAVLQRLGPLGRVVCFEPATAMRWVGAARLVDPRVDWLAGDPSESVAFDRVLCGAALWQMLPLADTFERLARLVAPRGALCFNVPALYLGVPDEPGGGDDPWLRQLPAQMVKGRRPVGGGAEPLPDANAIEHLLHAVGLRPVRWSFRIRLTQAAYCDWLKIPPMTNGWLAGLDADARARRIDRAYQAVDAASWRWERWLGWTAWKP